MGMLWARLMVCRKGANYLVNGMPFRISYQNGVTLTAVNSTTVQVTSSTSGSSVFGQSTTFTATVNSGAGSPTGMVSFMEGNAVLGMVPRLVPGISQRSRQTRC